MSDIVDRLRNPKRALWYCREFSRGDDESLDIQEAADEIERLRGLLRDVSAVVSESSGVYGFHLNGDLETWDYWPVFARIDAALAGAAVQPSDVASTFADCELAMGMEYETDPSGVPTEADLLAWGYAPGNYSSRCFTCGRMIDGVDKRCGICRACAITRWTHAKARAAVPTTEVQK